MHRLASLSAFLLLACAAPAADAPAPPAPADSARWRPALQHGLAAREYRASRNRHGLQAPNRAHGLRTYFGPTGIRVVDRTAPGSPELVTLSLARWGRPGAWQTPPLGEIRPREARVEIERPGLVEWYENSAVGLEQGFTLAERPPGQGELVLEVHVDAAKVTSSGDDLVFRSPTGRRLAYGALVARDAGGVEHPARLEPTAAGFRIAVADAGARYPLSIGPLLTATFDAQLESDQPDAQLGYSVASAGDVNGDGYADVIVGAWEYDAGQSNEGAAFVFLGGAGGIAGVDPAGADTQLEADQANARLGRSVASAGDVNGDGYADVIVGAPFYDAGTADEGAAFVFLGGPGGIPDGDPTTAHAQLESQQFEAELGASVASAGDVNGDGFADVIVGAPRYEDGDIHEGAAFVFLGSAAGIPDGDPASAHAQLEADQIVARLGQSVASAGDVNADGYADVIVGAPEYDAGQTDEGAAFVFLGGAGGIGDGTPASADAVLQSDQMNAELGWSVASAGDVNGDGFADVIVAALVYDAGQADEGAAFLFLGGPGAGIASGNPGSAHFTFQTNQPDAWVLDVASAGDVNGDGYADVIVGSPQYDAGQADEGAAFVFLGSAAGIANGSPTSADSALESDQMDAELGWSVASAGDVNGDGYSDVIAGARFYDAGETDEGAAFVFLGAAAGIADSDPASAHALIQSDEQDAELGWSATSAGDVNGDGYGDVIVGAYFYDAGQFAEGAAFVFLGGPGGVGDGDPASAHARLESDQAAAQLGYSVASAGDVDGDGYADVIVGAFAYNAGEPAEGTAFVFRGGPSGIADGSPATADAQLESDQASAQLGWSVASAGDVNGDGYADVIVGAPGYSDGQAAEGAAFVFLGGPGGIPDGDAGSAHARLESDQGGAHLGFDVASAGDVNADGYADVIVGADDYAAGQAGEGAAFVFHGSAGGIADGNPTTAQTQLESDQVGAHLGASVASAGDVNGDGYADVIVGAPFYTLSGNQGIALIYLGSSSGIPTGDVGTADALLPSDQPGAVLGRCVSPAGDVNGDGYADVIVGASGYDAGDPNEGAAFVFLGSSEGRPVRARQLRGDGSGTPVQPWGSSEDVTAFQVSLFATSPRGRERAGLEVETCAAGVPFGDVSCASQVSAAWTDLGIPGATLTGTIPVPVPGMHYRWRARVLYAPIGVTEAGVMAPPSPRHGPWRRHTAQAEEADILPEPGPLSGFAAGAALLAALARRRRASRRGADS